MKKSTRLIVLVLAVLTVVAFATTAFAGDNPPTTQGTLPYYVSNVTINSFVFTNSKWAPSNTGEIYVATTYKTSNGNNANLYHRLFWGSSEETSHLAATGSAATKASTRFYNLSTNKIYSVKFTTNNKLTFSSGIGKTLASAKNF